MGDRGGTDRGAASLPGSRPHSPAGVLPTRAAVRRSRAAACTAATLGGVGTVLLLIGVLVPQVPASSMPGSGMSGSAVSDPATSGPAPAVDPPAVPVDPVPPPVHLVIPAIDVDAALMPLGLNADGTVMVPPVEPGAPAGWYRHRASPGEPGPAVLLGHVDSHQGPAVFSRLAALQPGDAITVRRADGSTVAFAVDSVRTHPKSEFPTEAVYGGTVEPALRLVTCGGAFDPIERTYLSNVVVYASLLRQPP